MQTMIKPRSKPYIRQGSLYMAVVTCGPLGQ